jgi:hypothetical protein
MKSFLLFLAASILVLFALSFQFDMDRMTEAEYGLKDLALECVVGSKVVLQERGMEEARRYADRLLSDSIAGHIPAFDAAGGYDFHLTNDGGKFAITLKIRTADFFRLPMFHITELTATAQTPAG